MAPELFKLKQQIIKKNAVSNYVNEKDQRILKRTNTNSQWVFI